MDQCLYIQIVILMLVILIPNNTSSMSAEEKTELRKQVLSMFNHGYRSYMDFAYPADELMPLSCKGRYRGVEKSRGDVDDILGNYSLTLIDALDTLVVLGELEEFDRSVRLVINGVNFDTDIVVSVFEANIRVLGGLLGGHVMAKYLKSRRKGMDWYRDELLEKAKDIGERLLPAFNTTTGMPYPRVNLRYGVKHVMSRTGSEKDTCTACAGTMILEFSALSRLTGDPIFEEKAHKAMSYLWQSRHRSTDLVGTVINIHNGDWVRRDSGVGAGIDSYYEYLLKAYILLGDDTYLNRFNKHYAAIRKYVTQGPLLVDVHMHKPLTNSRNFMDALLAFWPGLQVLIGDMKPAIETHEMLYQVMQRHNFLPEAFTTDFRIHWAHHPLRPEFLESTYFLYKATGDPHYLEVGKEVLNNLNTHARVKCGYAAIRDVTTGAHEDQMDSYVLAETFKYLYLLFSEPEDLVLDIEQFVFTTEAHLLPLSLSTHNNSQNGTRMAEIDVMFDTEDEAYERTCPNTNHVYQGDYVKTFRDPLKNMVGSSCPVSHSSRRPRLKAADFMAGNKAQMDELKRMGITIITMKDGRVQLLHTAADAQSTDSAEDGMNFMQEMIELSKNQQAQGNEAQHEPCVVQYMVPPYLGTVSLNAGPAQFGHDLRKHGEVKGEMIVADPLTACQSLDNEIDVYGKIVVTQRGDCMFVDKARQIQGAGAIGGIVIDSHEGTTSSSQPLFAMSGDGTDDILIPMVFVFHAEGQKLLQALDNFEHQFVFLTGTEKKAEDVMSELLSMPEQKLWIEEASGSFEMDEADLDPVIVGGRIHRTDSINLDGMHVNIRTTKPIEESSGEKQDPATDDSTKSSLDSLVSNFVAELTMHTNFESLRKTNAYLVAIKQMMAAISSSNYQLMDSNSLAFLEELTKELRPKVKAAVPSPDKEEVDPGALDERYDQEISFDKETIVSDLEDEIDTVIIQELQRVVEEAAGLVSPVDSPSDKYDHASGAAEDAGNKESLRPYATAEELMGHIPEDGVLESSGKRYLPPNVEQAPDWMTLESGEVIMTDGHIYADLTQRYWDWAREAINDLRNVPSNADPPAQDGGPSTSKLPALSEKCKDLGHGDPIVTSTQVPESTRTSSHTSDSLHVDKSSNSPRSVHHTSHEEKPMHLDNNNELSETERTPEESKCED